MQPGSLRKSGAYSLVDMEPGASGWAVTAVLSETL